MVWLQLIMVGKMERNVKIPESLRESYLHHVLERTRTHFQRLDWYYKEVNGRFIQVNDIPHFRKIERFKYNNEFIYKALDSGDIPYLISILEKINICYAYIKQKYFKNLNDFETMIAKKHGIYYMIEEDPEEIKTLIIILKRIWRSAKKD